MILRWLNHFYEIIELYIAGLIKKILLTPYLFNVIRQISRKVIIGMENQAQQEQNQSQLTKKERQHMRRQDRQNEREKTQKARGQKNIFVWLVAFVIIVAAGFGVYKYLFGTSGGDVALDPFKICVNHGGVGMHIHPQLSIVINKENEDIRSSIGISGNCMRAIHTHDETGRLHVEFPQNRNFTLGEFFNLWNKPFSASQILDSIVDDTHQLIVKVNGESSIEYENLVLNDRDNIEIRYEEINSIE